MASPRRWRHKLMLGLALVVSSAGLFLGGRNAYPTTARTTDRKLYELKQINILIAILEQPIQVEPVDATTELKQFLDKTRMTHRYIKEFQKEHAITIAQGLEPAGEDFDPKPKLIQALDDGLTQLENALARYDTTRVEPLTGQGFASPRNDPEVRKVFDSIRLVAEHLRLALIDDITTSVERSNASIRQSIRTGVVTLSALVMVAAFMYYFREWKPTPLRELQAPIGL